ncbi:MAG: DegT/DnrJ/EryC1/StrS family aminotransferase [Geminicoccaceae bacterium]
MSSIAFIDLASQRERLQPGLDQAIARVIAGGQYIMGPEVAEFEAALSAFCGARHSLGCASGTDALGLALMALEVKPHTAVLCPSFTFAATAEVVAWLGAVPVFVDCDPVTFNATAEHFAQGLKTARDQDVEVVGIITVDLFGQPADYDTIEAFCEEEDLWLIVDAAQSFGGHYKGRKAGSIGRLATTSFYPAKPLGAYGDGGAVFTDNDELQNKLVSLRVHGQGEDRYDNVRIGMNGRLDTLQAAILLQKLAILADEIDARQRVADRYATGLAGLVKPPEVIDHTVSAWAQYTVQLEEGVERGPVLQKLREAGVPTAIYYPKPLHRQTAYRHYPTAGNGLPVSDEQAKRVFSLPMHPYLNEADQGRVIDAVAEAL